MTKFYKVSVLFLLMAIAISCGGQDCNLIDNSFESYQNALQTIESSDFKFSDDCNTSKSSWIHDAEYYSCDVNTGFLIVKTKTNNYVHKNVPIKIWNEFKNADSFGKY